MRLLTDLGREQPVLLVLNDLHDADPCSLDLVRYLAQLALQRPWLMAGTAREEDMEAGSEFRAMIEATTRERLCQKIDLPCLSRQDSDQLVRAMLPGRRVGDELAAEIYHRSGGNPLFIGELVREMQQRGEPVPASGGRPESSWVAARVPARVRTLTAMRLSAMDETLRRVLGLAAAAGATQISLGKLRAAAAALEPPVPAAALLDALDGALQMRLLEEHNSGYAFRHPLIRSALYEGLTRHRRDQFHAALATAPGRNPRRLAVSPAG